MEVSQREHAAQTAAVPERWSQEVSCRSWQQRSPGYERTLEKGTLISTRVGTSPAQVCSLSGSTSPWSFGLRRIVDAMSTTASTYRLLGQ